MTVAGAAPTASSVVGRLGVRLDGDAAPLLGLALRDNPRRAQLLVSRVLGKHVPTDPRLVRAAGLLLSGLVEDVLAGRPGRPLPVGPLHAAVGGDRAAAAALHGCAERAVDPVPRDALVLGFAETATGLGHVVSEGLGGTDYLHSTRRPSADPPVWAGFTEDHSHATDHLLAPAGPALLRGDRPLVLVDDELSTGRTALNVIGALQRRVPRDRYVLAALVDLRPDPDALPAAVRALGAHLDVVALARGRVHLPADLPARAAALRADLVPRARTALSPEPLQRTSRWPDAAEWVRRLELAAAGWPAGLPAGGRHGFRGTDHAVWGTALPGLAAAVARGAGLVPGSAERVLVLGTEELMALPLRLAQTLAEAGHDVAFSTTTRSPALVVDEPDYALRSGLTFPAHDHPADGPGPRYAYNLGGSAEPRWDHVLLVVDPPADSAALATGLLPALLPAARRLTVVVTP